jgi:hypothetical protein
MRDWDFLHSWHMPFAWFVVSCAITIPLAIYMQQDLVHLTGSEIGAAYGTDWVLRDDYLETIVPYLFSIVAGVWLIDGSGTTRWAALWCLVAAIGRLAVPLWIVNGPDITGVTGQHYIDWATLRPLLYFADLQMALFGVMVWALFGHFAGAERGFHSSHEPAY